MPGTHPARLLTTRLRSGLAVGLTAFVLALAVRGTLHLGQTPSGWLLPLDFVLHGWPLIAANVAFYAYLCWLAFWFIRSTQGRERVITSGWFVNILLSPLEHFAPGSAFALNLIGALGLAIALFAAVSLLLHPAPVAESDGSTA